MYEEDSQNKIELRLSQDDFIRIVIEALSGCVNPPDELVEMVKRYSNFVPVAVLVGEWLRVEGCDGAEKVGTVLRTYKGNEKLFTLHYIWEVIFKRNTKLADLEAIPLILRAYFGPLPRKFFEEPIIDVDIKEGILMPVSKRLTEEIGSEQKDEWVRDFTAWLSTPKVDSIEEILRSIVTGRLKPSEEMSDEIKSFIEIIEAKRRRFQEACQRVGFREEIALLWLATMYLLVKLNRDLSEEPIECWRRVIYILGTVINGCFFKEFFDYFFKTFKDGGLFQVAESSRVDDWLLVNGEVPPSIRRMILLLVTIGLSPIDWNIISEQARTVQIKPVEWSCKEIENVISFIRAQQGVPRFFTPYIAGLSFTSLYTCIEKLDKVLYLLNCILAQLGPLAAPNAICDLLSCIGEKLNWPEELVPLLNSHAIGYCPGTIYQIADRYWERKRMKVWVKAFLAWTYAELSSLPISARFIKNCIERARDLLRKIRKDDERMGWLATAYTMGSIARAYLHLGKLKEAEKALNELKIATSKLEKVEDLLKSGNVIEFLKWVSADRPEESIQRRQKEAYENYLDASATLNYVKGLRLNKRELLERAVKELREAASLAKSLGKEGNYLIYRLRAAAVRLYLEGFREELFDELAELWKETLEGMRPLRDYLKAAALCLAYYIVALALIKGDWRRLLEEHGNLLEYDPELKVKTLLMLNVLAGYEGRPSDEEIRLATEGMTLNEAYRSEIIKRLRKDKVELAKYLKDDVLWELVAPTTTITRFIFLLKALSNRSYGLAMLHALIAKELLPREISQLYEELAEALGECKGGELSERAKLALAKLYYL